MALSRLFHNLVQHARNERLPVIVLKKGVDKSILVDARSLRKPLYPIRNAQWKVPPFDHFVNTSNFLIP